MLRKRASALLISLATVLAGGTASFASAPAERPTADNRQPDPNSPRMLAARQLALAESTGTEAIADSRDNTGWTSKHTLYVGCTNTPPSKTYATLSAAFAAVIPYTTIQVCAGQYPVANVLNISNVAVIGRGGQGAVTFSCGTTQNPLNRVYGIVLNGSYESVKNVTVNNCNVGVFISEAYSEVLNDEVSDSFFNDNYSGVETQDCRGCSIETNEFSDNTSAIYDTFNFEDRIVGNEILGDGSGNDDGIYIEDDLTAVVKSNRVSGSYAGVDVEYYCQYLDIENNTLNGNEYGVYVAHGNSGNTFKKNVAEGNTIDGFFADLTSGANAPVGGFPNRYLDNKAFGNGTYDYEDDTAPYTGSAHGTNSGTADFYADNKGNTASPSAIFNQ